MEQEILDKLIDFVIQNFMVERDEINLDESLVDAGIIDSTGLVEIVSFMEYEFSITIADDQLNRENFGSILRMARFVGEELADEDAV